MAHSKLDGIIVCLLVLLASCTSVTHVPFVDIGGNPCELVKIRPDFYSAEDYVSCIDKTGQVAVVPTEHTDLSMLYGVGGMAATLISVVAAGGL